MYKTLFQTHDKKIFLLFMLFLYGAYIANTPVQANPNKQKKRTEVYYSIMTPYLTRVYDYCDFSHTMPLALLNRLPKKHQKACRRADKIIAKEKYFVKPIPIYEDCEDKGDLCLQNLTRCETVQKRLTPYFHQCLQDFSNFGVIGNR